jgi:hypothetical protein
VHRARVQLDAEDPGSDPFTDMPPLDRTTDQLGDARVDQVPLGEQGGELRDFLSRNAAHASGCSVMRSTVRMPTRS